MNQDVYKFPVEGNSKLFISEISSAIWLIRAPLFAAIIAGLALTTVDQLHEILFLFSEETFQEGFQIFFAGGLFLLFCFLLWKVSHDLLAVAGYKDAYMSRRAGILRRFLPVVVAVIPVLSLYVGLNAAYSSLAIIPSESIGSQGEASKTPEASAAQVAQASKSGFTARQLGGFRPEHAVIRAELNKELGNLAKPGPTLGAAALGALSLAFLLLVAGCVHAILARSSFLLDSDDRSVVPRSLRWKWIWTTGFIILLTLFALQGQRLPGSWEMTAVPRWLGTSAVILLFLIFLTIFLSLLTRLYDRLEIPAISVFLIIALFASYKDWNNNHAVQLLDRGTGAHNPPPLSALFASWVKALPGRDNPDGYFQKYLREKNQDYPVFLFALQGGGQYSSTFASLTLAKLFDRCPALRHHVFALSGVSGGAVGGGMFVAQLKTELANPGSVLNSDRCDFDLGAIGTSPAETSAIGPLEAKISKLEQNDFLAPLAASGLFGDFLQRFLPGPPIPTFDRGRAFEAGMESAWRNTNPGKQSPLEADFLDHWSPSGNVPMLLLNTTRVQTGEPILIAPFQTRRPVPNAAELRTIYPDAVRAPNSIRLSTAMSLSARFPVVAPIGRMQNDKSNAYFDLVDGGYFENSGAETIRVVHEELAFYRNYPELIDPSGELKPVLQRIRFKAIVLNEVDSDDNKYNGQTLNELSSPVNALYRARTQRGEMAINRLFSSLDLGVIRISHDPFPLPLGWRLSLSKQDFISSMVGTPNECNDTNPRDIVKAATLVATQYQDELKKFTTLDDGARKRIGTRIGNLYYLMHRNRCVLRDIIRDVRVGG